MWNHHPHGSNQLCRVSRFHAKAGGPYVYLREAFGSFWAFLYGWTLFFAIETGAIAAVAVVFGRAGFALFSHQAYGSVTGEIWPVRLLALGCVTFLTLWNAFGVRMGAFIQNVFTVLKIAAILALIGFAFTKPQVEMGVSLFPATLSKDLVVGFGAAMIAALWAYDCWYQVMFAGEEIVNPKRTLPLALIFGTGLVMVLYCLANWVYIHVLPVAEIQQLQSIKGIAGIEAAKAMMGTRGGLFITVAILCSTFGCVNGVILSGPRAYYAMAKDRLFFPQAAQLHPTYRTPILALILQLVWTSLLIVLPGQTYDKLFTYVEFTSFLFYAITIIGLFVLRAKHPELPRPFKVPSVIPVLYFIMVTAFLLNTVWTHMQDSMYGLVIVGVGALIYFLMGGGKKVGITTT